MKKNILLPLLFSATMILGCSPDDTEKEEDNFKYLPVQISVGSVENCAETETLCAMSDICGEEFLNLIDFQYVDSRIEFTMYFNSEIQDNFSLETLKSNFEYLNFALRFPEQKTETTSFVYSHSPSLTELVEPSKDGFVLTFEDYNDGVLTGSLTGKITEMTKHRQSDDPDCIMEDVMGVCEEQIIVEKEVDIDFSFCLDN